MSARIIAIANQKGGVGKTTTAVNLSYIFSETQRVLLIDNDPQGNATKGFTLDRVAPESDTLSLYSEEIDNPIAPIVATDNLCVLGTHIHLAAVAERTFEVIFDFRARINSLRDYYDLIIIDCLPNFGYLLNAALISSDYLVVPTELDIFALDGLRDLMQSVERIRNRHNPNLTVLGIVPNKVNGAKTRIQKNIEEELVRLYDGLMLETQITQSTKIPESHAYSQAITDHAPSSAQAKQYRALAEELMARMDRMETRHD